MRSKSALAAAGLLITLGCFWMNHSTAVISQDVVEDSARGDEKRATSSLALGSPYDMQAQWSFEQSLNPDERAKLISLKSRFAIADTDCPLPTSVRQPFYVKFNAPLRRELADRLMAAGLSFLGYAYPHAHMVRALDGAALERVGEILRRAPEVEGTLLRLPMDALHERAWLDYNNPEMNSGAYRVIFWRDVSVGEAEALLSANGVPVKYATRGEGGRIDFETPFIDVWLSRQALVTFAQSDLIEWIEPTPQLVEHNVDSVALSNATPAQVGPGTSYNLDGTGVVIAVWDGGRARDTHTDFQNAPSPSPINNGTKRILKVDGTSVADHATHVTGTIVGDGTGNAGATGYAPQACALSYYWNSMDAERRTARHDYRHAADNHSYGTGTPSTYNSSYYGGYGGDSQSSDIDIRDIWLNMCKSAGNDGDISGSSGPGDATCTDDSCMKNSSTIAAVSDSGNLASFSSRGPTNDGRMIPHYAANGVSLLSTGPSSDTDYLGPGGWSGTSMSSPSACGSITLLTQLWYREMNDQQFAPDVVRGLLAATAIEAGNQGPDYQYGFGIVDCQRAADLILANKAGGDNHIIRGSIRQGDTVEYSLTVTSSATPLKVVCSWLDIYASTSASTLLVNNIDLELVAPNGTTIHYPWSGLSSGAAGDQTYQFTRTGSNQRDNIELVEVDNPAVGTWTVRVKGTSIPAVPQNTVLNDATGFVLVSENAMGNSQERFEDALNSGSPVSIPDNNATGITRTFNVSNANNIKNVRVYVDVRHTNRGDLDIYLTHGAITAHIETSDTSTRDDLIGVYPDTRQYDDDTDAFIGTSAAGIWTVRVTDTSSGNTGTLEWLAIEIDYDSTTPANQPPTADAGSNQTVNEGATVNLNGSASSDPDFDTLTYQWVRLSGPAISIQNSNTATPSFVAPQVASTQTVVVQLTVDDGNGGSDTDTVSITVNNVPAPNNPPTANAGADFSVTEGNTGQLNGTASSDPDMDTLTYAWLEVGTSLVSLSSSSSASPTFTAPQVSTPTTVTFQLTVDDGNGGSDADTVVVTILDSAVNNAPTAVAGQDAYSPWGGSVSLNGTGSSDPENDTLSYAWTQTGGANTVTLTGANTATPGFTAPGVDDVLVFQLLVDDGNGNSSTDSVTITVNETGAPPGGSSSGGGGGGGGGGCSSDGDQTWLYAALLALLGTTLLRRRRRA
ncbi:MAG: S8 family serine peptidase [Planctomycetota bacterium]